MPSTDRRVVSNVRLRGAAAYGLVGLFGLVPAAFVAYSGIRALVLAQRHPSPRPVTYAEFVQTRPRSGWYHVRGCVVDVAHSVFWTQNGVVAEAYAPLMPASGPRPAAPGIYVQIDDRKVRAALQDLTYARRNGGEPAVERHIAERQGIFVQRRDVSGLVSVGRRDPLGEWARLGIDPSQATFIADGWQPSRTWGIGGTLGGLALMALCAVLAVRSRR